MKTSLYTVSYAGIWYDGPALSFEEIVKRAKDYGYDGIELDGKHRTAIRWTSIARHASGCDRW